MPLRVVHSEVLLIALAVGAVALLGGCSQQRGLVESSPVFESQLESSGENLDAAVVPASYEEADGEFPADNFEQPAPFSLKTDSTSVDYWDMTLDEAIHTGLSNSNVLSDLGARILQAPTATPTIFNPSIQATDPRFGVEAALAEFDANFATRAFFEKNDRFLNNNLLGGGTNRFIQDLWRVETELRKQAATGAEFSLRQNIEDDLNNAPANVFGSQGQFIGHAWDWNFEAEIRQPLLQGSGVEFNRIAGPSAAPGEAGGVLIAKINTQISAADFQLSMRNYLSNIENAYWDLLFAYRDLDVKKKARDRSLEIWQLLKVRQEQGIAGEEDKIAQAAEQYFRLEQEVETALGGRLVVNTRDFNGSPGGTFQGTGGVYVAERRLRLMLGLPINDGRLIRPINEPTPVEVEHDWHQLVQTAMAQRTELVQQRLRIKRRDLELIANRNFLLPTLDVVGRYRRRGLGDGLYDPRVPSPAGGAPPPLVDSGTDEWQVGLELEAPLGYRKANAAVRNSELQLAREKAILAEMEREIVYDISNAVAEQQRVFQLVKTTFNRRVQAEQQFNLLSSPDYINTGRADYALLLDATRRLEEADSVYQAALVNYAVALKNVHLEQGDLMAYCNVHLADDGTSED